MAEPKNAQLVERAQRGEMDAFAELVRRFQQRSYRTARAMMGNHGDADDVTQESFLRAYRGLPRFDGRADFGTWLHRIVINTALNQLRRRRRGAQHTASAEAGARVAEPGPDPLAQAESRERAVVVMAALEALSPTLRATLILATVEDMAYKDIAETLGVPAGTVAWRINQARRLLRERLATMLPGTEGDNDDDADDVLRRTKDALGAS